jgi:choline dehydrogenase-like flavoprotein
VEVNGDINAGDPTGFGLSPTNYHNGIRITAATAYLSSPPPNLTVVADTIVSKVISNSETVVGVETISGKTYKASKEVILSAGAFDTPKILLLSGIGPSAELSSLSIPVVKDIPGVGKNLKDHCLGLMTVLVKPHTPINIPTISQIASNSLREINTQCPMAWMSSPEVKSSTEFTALDGKTIGHLTKVPSFELMAFELPMEPGLPPLGPDDRVITFCAGVMNPQSSGTVTLSSSDPTKPCIIDPKYLSHPYDRRVAIEALRSALKLSKVPTFVAVTEKTISVPEDDSDDKLFEHFKKSLSPIWHYAGTCKMGREDDETAVVEKDFRVRGVKGLRVVDLSVAAVLPNNHTQSTAYLIGETAAEKMIEEYGL